jgi:hypothetical protein
VSRISMSTASVFAFTTRGGVFKKATRLNGNVFLTILYGNPRAEAKEPSLAKEFPVEDDWRFCLPGLLCSQSAFREVRGLLTLVPGAGSSSILAEGPLRGFLGRSERESRFPVSNSGFSPSLISGSFRQLQLSLPPSRDQPYSSPLIFSPPPPAEASRARPAHPGTRPGLVCCRHSGGCGCFRTGSAGGQACRNNVLDGRGLRRSTVRNLSVTFASRAHQATGLSLCSSVRMTRLRS